jgi:succinate dehydrogenase flavin-adding protein (antitoxin of CptAB toxin-antitoxin module)
MVLFRLPIFQQSVDAELYLWLLEEQKRLKADTVQDVIRQILREAKVLRQSIGAELYEWLMKEQKRRKARTVQEVVRQILQEAKMEAEKHG